MSRLNFLTSRSWVNLRFAGFSFLLIFFFASLGYAREKNEIHKISFSKSVTTVQEVSSGRHDATFVCLEPGTVTISVASDETKLAGTTTITCLGRTFSPPAPPLPQLKPCSAGSFCSVVKDENLVCQSLGDSPCPQGDAILLNDTCGDISSEEGACGGTCIMCPDVCPPGKFYDGENCVQPCASAGDCTDNNSCTEDFCENQICIHNARDNCSPPLACDDQNPCTIDAAQENGSCSYTPMDCEDSNECTTDSCQGGACIHEPQADCNEPPVMDCNGQEPKNCWACPKPADTKVLDYADADCDGQVNASELISAEMCIIDFLNGRGSGQAQQYDLDKDGYAIPLDLLLLIDYGNRYMESVPDMAASSKVFRLVRSIGNNEADLQDIINQAAEDPDADLSRFDINGDGTVSAVDAGLAGNLLHSINTAMSKNGCSSNPIQCLDNCKCQCPTCP